MLFVIIIFAIGYVGVMNWLVFQKSDTGFVMVVGLAPIGLVACSFVSPVLLAQCVAVTTLFGFHRRYAPDRPLLFFRLSLLIVIGLFTVASVASWMNQRDLRHQFPMESMADRVPLPKPGNPHVQLAEQRNWTDLETALESDRGWRTDRGRRLRQLHEQTTLIFIDSPGFGVMRGPRVPTSARDFEYRPETEDAPPVLEFVGPQDFSTDEVDKPYRGNFVGNLTTLHFAGVRDFVNINGFGYVKDRQHVAGFHPHQFSKMPAGEKIVVRRLELVSLLMHAQPAVYVSKELPRMTELTKAPTRRLTELEGKGLAVLQAGEDLFVREIDGMIHMLGAIRSISQCIQCHGGERGDLLGAFSYSMHAAARP